MQEPVWLTVSGRSPSDTRYRRAWSVSGMFTSERWSITVRLSSSGTRRSKQRLPASMWKMGILRRFAERTASAVFVSP